jgi:hypothetical protein
VDLTLQVIALQSDLLSRAEALQEGEAPRFDERLVLRAGALDQPRIYLERHPPKMPGDSGWFLSIAAEGEDPRVHASPDAADYTALRIFELLRLRPALLGGLAFPPGWMLVYQGDEVEAIINPQNQLAWPRS